MKWKDSKIFYLYQVTIDLENVIASRPETIEEQGNMLYVEIQLIF